MKKYAPASALTGIVFFFLLLSAKASDYTDTTLPATRYIDPTIGNIGRLLEPTRPTANLPNQLIRMYPMRNDYLDDQVSSFPLTIVSHRLGQVFPVMPSIEKNITGDSWKHRATYDHDLEITRPWYYSTYLVDENIKVEFVPGKKCGVFRFSFPANAVGSVLFGNYNDGPSSFDFPSPTEISGMETYHGNIKVYMYGRFGRHGTPIRVDDRHVSMTFAESKDPSIEFKYAISYISPQQAKSNFHNEFDKLTDLAAFKKRAEREWEKIVGQIDVEGGTEAQKRSFYTALYRCHERMVNITEDNQYYSGFDNRVHRDSIPFYVDDWTWDTYLALHPLNMLLHPAREQDMLRSYVRMYEQGNWMPSFPVLFGDHACMNGHHASELFLDAYRKGLRDYDVEKAYEGIKRNSTEGTLLPWRRGSSTALDDFYHEHGYMPALWPGEKETVKEVNQFEKRQAVAVTLGASYDDWAIAELAGELHRTGDHDHFEKSSLNYKNLWNADAGMFMPKDSAGKWIDINPKFDGGPGGRDYFDENNGWTYLWQVQRDVPSLIHLLGGARNFEQKLDQLYRENLGMSKFAFWNTFPDATGLVGQFSMGNEPSFHIPYLYNFTGSPWKTQKRIRYLLDLWFGDNVFGIPGDEDGGGMSAFVVFSSMGFYPIAPGRPVYTIGSPVFSKIVIRLENGRQFRLIAHNSSVVNKYIQRARLNGKVLNSPWFTHEQLVNGATLELEMGPLPNKGWGTGN